MAYNNSGMKDLEAEMRDIAFKAEEMIEMELSNIYLQSSRTEACLLKLHRIFKKAVKQTDYLKKKLNKIKSKHQFAKGPSTTGVSLLGRMRQRGLLLGSTSSQPADPEAGENNITVSKFSKNASIKFDSRMVGCSEEFKMIMDQLTQQSAKQRQVVSIVGMGGIGKTTLARKVYEDSSITSHFDKRAWITVSQEYDVEQMLQCLIHCVNAASNGNLAESLRKHLKDQRYLIVMDDIWSTTAWDSVHRCFPDDNNGSRILLTSRLREVVEYANSGNSTINMPFLDANESWNLYCNVFGQTKFISVFEQIGRNVVKKCNGLPLAIIVIASLLSKTEAAVEKWNNVAENVSRYVIGDLLPLTKSFQQSRSFHYPYAAYSYYSKRVERPFSHFKLLRVVDIEWMFLHGDSVVDIEWMCSYGYRVLNALANLIHLRYLTLRNLILDGNGYFHLELLELWNMQSFIVLGPDATFHSVEASGIWKMPLLRNLCIERIVSLQTSPVVHRNLESISWLDSKLCTKDLFTRIPNLKKLGIDGRNDENNLDCFYNFVHLGQLEKLSIRKWRNLNCIPCSGISWATSFLPNLKKLKFYSTSLAWSDIRVIGMLPNLEVLKLKDAIDRKDKMWEPSKEGFRQLKRLVIEDTFLERWSAMGDHFPLLECLELRECNNLQKIPSGFADITTLALIQLNWCWDSVLASAKLIQEEQYNNYGNAILVRSENIMTKGVNNKEEEWEEEWDVEEEIWLRNHFGL